MIILTDMDGVITNLESRFLELWSERFPNKQSIPIEKRTTFYQRDQYPEELAEEIMNSKDFYGKMKPLPKAIESLKEIAQSNVVFICTSPKTRNPYCIPEKLEWITQYLGKDFLKRTILTKDKTLIQGDILIDDKPSVRGVCDPIWKHIVYKQPYNQGEFTWENWENILKNQEIRVKTKLTLYRDDSNSAKALEESIIQKGYEVRTRFTAAQTPLVNIRGLLLSGYLDITNTLL